jgi:hypothetical protein
MAKKGKQTGRRLESEAPTATLEPPRRSRWSKRFLATCGAWKEEIPRPPQIPVNELKDPFD